MPEPTAVSSTPSTVRRQGGSLFGSQGTHPPEPLRAPQYATAPWKIEDAPSLDTLDALAALTRVDDDPARFAVRNLLDAYGIVRVLKLLSEALDQPDERV